VRLGGKIPLSNCNIRVKINKMSLKMTKYSSFVYPSVKIKLRLSKSRAIRAIFDYSTQPYKQCVHQFLNQIFVAAKFEIHEINTSNRTTQHLPVPSLAGLRACVHRKQESLALASMARDDPPASSMASSTAPASSTAAAMRGKVGSEFET